MVVGDEEQHGRLTHSSWLRRADEQFCDFSDRFGFPTFRRALRVQPGDVVSIRLHKEEPPLEVGLRAWRRVDAHGHPAGDSTPVPVALAPAGDEWEMRFVAAPEHGHLYLLAEAYWADTEECAPQPDLGSQYASWTFHVRVR